MTGQFETLLVATFLVFCRIGCSIFVLPGWSSSQIPTRVRLFVTIGCTLSLAPLVTGDIVKVLDAAGGLNIARLIASECLVGLTLGLCGRLILMCVEFAGTAVASFISFSPMPGAQVEEFDQSTSFTTYINLGAVMLIFVTGLHLEAIEALLKSYWAVPVQAVEFAYEVALSRITRILSEGFFLALQLMSPFLLYSLLINLLFGLANKLLPQMSVYFISTPAVVLGGLGICILALTEWFNIFIEKYGHWILTGNL